MFFGLVAWLYYLCFLLLTALLFFIACRRSRRTPTRFRLRRSFFLLALSLLLWQLTLFLEIRIAWPGAQLWLGRTNFAAIVFVVYFALRFVQEVPTTDAKRASSLAFWLLAETSLLAILTLLTPLVSAEERVESGQAITTYGPLFPLYLLHALGYLVATLILAFWERCQAERVSVRRQLTLISSGMFATGSIAFVTNAWFPYLYRDFRFCNLGALSTLLFVLAIAYATFLHRLFDLRILLRETLVYGILLAFVLGAYSSTVFLITQYLTDDTGKVTQFVVLLIAFSFDPLRRFLEAKADRLLFGERGGDAKRQGERESRFRLAFLFPWHR